MAMFFTREALMSITRTSILILLAATAAVVAGCTQSQVQLRPDHGLGLRSELAAQIANPEPEYERVLAPGYDGGRAALAQTRYRTGTVIQPTGGRASTVGVSSSPGQ